ncbi:hypothetical protein Pcinc_038326 [Petrolisthes cinctipes]|uniref:Uncharacterized protein n=1 Tax=Petrolisthes cinctipes TaxID=88211 RepID=A0AAE1BQS9_PETCI|nr:hypothetical protein Pcinc_038326 [Petrolisthes cinctipes]
MSTQKPGSPPLLPPSPPIPFIGQREGWLVREMKLPTLSFLILPSFYSPQCTSSSSPVLPLPLTLKLIHTLFPSLVHPSLSPFPSASSHPSPPPQYPRASPSLLPLTLQAKPLPLSPSPSSVTLVGPTSFVSSLAIGWPGSAPVDDWLWEAC